jgi:hypothetical protein
MPRRKKDSQPTIDVAVDEDLVQPTQYQHASQTELPPIYKNISSNPDFDPLKLEPIENSSPNLPKNIDSSNPLSVFSLLFDDSIIDNLVYYTNAYAKRTRARPAVRTRGSKPAAFVAKDDGDDDDDEVII